MTLHRLLLRLLPRRRRDRYADEMAHVFREQIASEVFPPRTKPLRVLALWGREFIGIARFSLRERLTRLGSALTSRSSPTRMGRGPGLLTELGWAWRGVRARGWRGAFVIGLLGVVLAANATMFSVADSLVFRPSALPEADRIVGLRGGTTDAGERIDAARLATLLEEWNRQPQVFSAAAAYMQKTLFLLGSGPTERVSTADVTPQIFDVVGIRPQWGRAFVAGDTEMSSGFTVIISEDLARRLFGRAHLAPGRTLEATAGRLFVVGVMPPDFAFPTASYKIWRALDLRGPLTRNFAPTLLARRAEGVDDEAAPALVEQAAALVGERAGLRSYRAEVRPYGPGRASDERRTSLLVLVGAALCLLLAACANVASLELAHAHQGAHAHAVRLALGASGRSLGRGVALEGALLLGGAVVVGLVVASSALSAVALVLPDSIRLSTQNPINFDGRAFGYMTAVGLAVWTFAALPPILTASRASLVAPLKVEDRNSVASGAGARLRRVLTVAQVALAVALVIGGLLYVRTYRSLLAVEKGFDSAGMAELEFTMPAQFYATFPEKQAFATLATEALVGRGLIEAATLSTAPPSLGDSPSSVHIEIDGGAALEQPARIGVKRVDDSYFRVVRLPLRAGRYFARDDQPTDVVVSETFARRFWPRTDAVGRSFRLNPNQPWNVVVGVVGDFRSGRLRMPQPDDDRLFYYQKWAAFLTGRAAAPLGPIDIGSFYGITALTVRIAPGIEPDAVLAAARAIDSRLRTTLTMVDDIYADQNADTRLAGRVVTAFSGLALVVALAGIYGVMVFLVTGRRREIGVRMALGASRADITRLVLNSSFRLVAAGAAGGVAGAILMSRWIESQLHGVSAVDPTTYGLVAVAVMGTALLATWHPARQAARIDPAVTLRPSAE